MLVLLLAFVILWMIASIIWFVAAAVFWALMLLAAVVAVFCLWAALTDNVTGQSGCSCDYMGGMCENCYDELERKAEHSKPSP